MCVYYSFFLLYALILKKTHCVQRFTTHNPNLHSSRNSSLEAITCISFTPKDTLRVILQCILMGLKGYNNIYRDHCTSLTDKMCLSGQNHHIRSLEHATSWLRVTSQAGLYFLSLAHSLFTASACVYLTLVTTKIAKISEHHGYIHVHWLWHCVIIQFMSSCWTQVWVYYADPFCH